MLKSESSLRIILIAAVLVVNGFAIALLVNELILAKDHQEHEVRTATNNLALLLEHRVAESVGKVDMSLRELAHGLERSLRRRGRLDDAEVRELLGDPQSGLAMFPDFIFQVTDAGGANRGGRAEPGNRASFADRDFFLAQRAADGNGMSITNPIYERDAKLFLISFARRYNHPDGRFAGVVVATAPLDFFADLLADLDVGPNGVAVLRDAETAVIVRFPRVDTPSQQTGAKTFSPELAAIIAKGAATASYRSKATADGIERSNAYRRLSAAPFHLIVGMASKDYLADWREKMWKDAAAASIFLLITSFLAWLLWRSVVLSETVSERNRLMLKHASDGVHVLDGNGNILEVSNSFCQMLGYRRDELIGSNVLALGVKLSPASLSRIIARQLAAKTMTTFETRLQRKDGSLVDVEVAGYPFDLNGRQVVYYAARDISLRKEAEERFEKFFVLIPDMVCIVSANWRFAKVNPAWQTTLGYSEEEILAASFLDFLHPDDRDATIYQLATLADSNTTSNFVNRHRCQDGSYKWLEWVITLSDDTTLFFASARDITERRRTEDLLSDHQHRLEDLVQLRTAELSDALDAAKLADRSKDEFLANMSHELRTPLNAVIGMASLAHGLSSDTRLRDYLNKIVASGKHLNHIVNDLLDLSKIAAGHLVFETATFSIRQLVAEAASLLEHRATEKGLRLFKHIDDAVPDVLNGDPLRVQQVLLNLLGNAVKFTKVGRIDLRLGVQAREADRVCLRIEVEDTGIGISAIDLEHLFKPFSQADATVSRQYGGTGLGLAICRNLVELMDGEIKVSSCEGKGSTFDVSLWLQLGEAADLPAKNPAAAALPAVRYQNARVLVAEDHPLNREIVEALLAEVGIASRMAENGREALDILNEAGPRGFDLVLMDIQMPIMDGLTATRKVRSRPDYRDLPIVAMTAHTLAHEREIAADAGINDHIGKPFDNATFYGVLAKWIARDKQQALPVNGDLPLLPTSPSGTASDLYSLQGIEVGEGLARFANDEARYRHWLNNFVDTAPGIAENIGQDLAAGRLEKAVKATHAFKGHVGMLGMVDLRELVLTLEHALREGAPADEALTRVAASIAQVRAQLAKVLAPSAGGDTSPAQGYDKVVWNDSFSVGVALLDAHHKKLINLINRLADCLASPGTRSAASFFEILSEMFDYTQVHFQAEEAHMRSIAYPEIAAHIGQHAEFIKYVAMYNHSAWQDNGDMEKLYHYLKNWFLTHILHSDRRFSRFSAER